MNSILSNAVKPIHPVTTDRKPVTYHQPIKSKHGKEFKAVLDLVTSK